MSKIVRIALVDDEPVVRSLVENEIQKSEGRFKLISSILSLEAAQIELPTLRPDLILMDILFENGSGVECVRKISPLLPKTGILMLTVSHAPDHIFQSLQAGAHGYIIKRDLEDKLLTTMDNIHRGFSDLSPSVARKIVEYFRKLTENRNVLNALTERESEVLRAIANGATNKEIARDLDIACPTVNTHLRNIYAKLHVHSRREAINKFRS